MTDDILELMDRRRLAKGDQQEYERLHKEVRRRCEEAKECWLNEKMPNNRFTSKSCP